MKDRVAVLIVALALIAPARGGAQEATGGHATIVIEATKLVPPVLTTMAGERVEFVNRAQRPVHVEFADSSRGHHVVQVPAGGPVWAVFHRPGTHPYVVHVYHGTRTDTLAGSVEVAEDPHHKYQSPECVATVMGVCIEP